MSQVDIENFTSDELSKEKLDQLINEKKSFKVIAVKDISFIVNKLEGAIEKKKLSCRVYTEYRTAPIAAGMFTPFTIVESAIAAAAVAAHNIATYNPDYEIGKNKLKSHVSVIYQRDN